MAFKLEDELFWQSYLGELRVGSGRHRAARNVGVTAAGVKAWLSREGNESRLAEAEEAQEEALEKVEDVLYESALAGEPWAVEKWLKFRASDKWSDKALSSGGSALALGSGGDLAREVERMAIALAVKEGVEVGRIVGALEARREDAIDVESVEIED